MFYTVYQQAQWGSEYCNKLNLGDEKSEQNSFIMLVKWFVLPH